jgi:tellurite resistance protein TerC
MTTTLLWSGFFALLGAMLMVDLLVVHRRPHAVKLRESLTWAGVWVGMAMLFNLAILIVRGPQSALEFLTGYLIEESLSVDNLFVFMLIFSYFRVPAEYQHKVLFWGILGAIVMRLGFIVAGVAMIQQFHWAIYVFGAILIVSGIKMWSHQETEIHPERNLVIRLFRRFWPVTSGYENGRFFVRVDGRRAATPLFVVLLLVETTDLLFAVDSIPAVLAITKDPFIVFSSNAFAILGLRTIYFALAEVIKLFHYLHYGLSLILVFVGVKMLLADVVHLPIGIALGMIGVTLTVCVLLSLARPRPPEPAAQPDTGPAEPPESGSAQPPQHGA